MKNSCFIYVLFRFDPGLKTLVSCQHACTVVGHVKNWLCWDLSFPIFGSCSVLS